MTNDPKHNEYWKLCRINVGGATTFLKFPLPTTGTVDGVAIGSYTVRTVEKSNHPSYSTVGRCLRIFREMYYLWRKVNGRRAVYRPYNDLSPPILCTRVYGQHVRGHPLEGRRLQNGDGIL